MKFDKFYAGLGARWCCIGWRCSAHSELSHGNGHKLAMQGAAILAKELHSSNGSYKSVFSKYYELYGPFVEKAQGRITRGINFLVSRNIRGIQEAYKRFK